MTYACDMRRGYWSTLHVMMMAFESKTIEWFKGLRIVSGSEIGTSCMLIRVHDVNAIFARDVEEWSFLYAGVGK